MYEIKTMPAVFENDWIEQLRDRYEKPGVTAPPVYRVATQEFWQPIRDEIEKTFGSLSKISQQKLLPKLRNPESFLQTYNELAVGGYFLQFGFRIEYERQFDRLTPDWLVSKDGEPFFLVECFTRTVSQEVESQQKAISELWQRIREIPVGVGIDISYQDQSSPVILNPALTKRIVGRLKNWLIRQEPEDGESINIEGLDFRIIYHNPKRSSPGLIGPSPSAAFVVNDLPVRTEIENKIRKYEELASALRLPLIIAITPGFETAIEVDDLENILYGEEVFQFLNDGTARIGRRENGLFGRKPGLSVLLGLWKSGFTWRPAVFHNPDANYPVAEDSFS